MRIWSPNIDADKDRLAIFRTICGDFFGSCVGLGDWFNVSITTVPYYHDGMIGLRDVRVDSLGRDGFYISGPGGWTSSTSPVY